MSDIETDSRLAAMQERMSSQGNHVSALESETRRGFEAIHSSLASLNTKFENSFATLNTKVNDSQRPQWQAYGVMLTAVVILGGLVYWPIREGQARNDLALIRLSETTVPIAMFADFKSTYENNRTQNRIDMNERFKAINDNLATTVPRAEHERVWNSIDQRFADQQRQIDLNTTANSAVYTQRDQTLYMRNELDQLKEQVLRYRNAPPTP